MSSADGEDLVSQLRLASARRRVEAFLEQIDELATSNFPHPDGREALEAIRDYFKVWEHNLSTPTPNTLPGVLEGTCIQALRAVVRYTPFLGFILRSTNVRNAFELHFPLKRMLQAVIGENAKLIMSSEWLYEPLTYPLTIDNLPNFVLIGAPASESDNVLMTPLAGHEIGHSAWRRHGLRAQMEKALARAFNKALGADRAHKAHLLEVTATAGISLDDLRHTCLKYGIKQLEELFCDFVGLYLFGEAYLYAFDYFLAPGVIGRDPKYPAVPDRFVFLARAAAELGLEVDAAIAEGWQAESLSGGLPADIIRLTDAAVAIAAPQAQAAAFRLLRKRGVELREDKVVERIMRAFKRQEPCSEGGSLAEIITAGWLTVRGDPKLWRGEEKARARMLNELMLKTVEVSEFKRRVEGHAERP